MKPIAFYAVFNKDRKEGYLTTDAQLSYEVEKGSTENCWSEEGEARPIATTFSEVYGGFEGTHSTVVSVTVDEDDIEAILAIAESFTDARHVRTFLKNMAACRPGGTIPDLSLTFEMEDDDFDGVFTAVVNPDEDEDLYNAMREAWTEINFSRWIRI